MTNIKQLSDTQLEDFMNAVISLDNRLKATDKSLTFKQVVAEFANNVGGIKVQLLSCGDGAALRGSSGRTPENDE